jgi:hypothetical protein
MSSIAYVIARYNEDLSWLDPIAPQCHIYNKGKALVKSHIKKYANYTTLDNLGRESHTYLSHIIEHYDDLTDIVVFSQGCITDHMAYMTPRNMTPLLFLKSLAAEAEKHDMSLNFLSSDKFHGECTINVNYGFKISEYKGALRRIEKCFGDWFIDTVCPQFPYRDFKCYMAAIFAVKKELILSRSKEYYERMLASLNHINPEEGHFFERSWYYIFNASVKVETKLVTPAPSKRRIALLLRGISYMESYEHYSGKKFRIDYRVNKGHVMDYVITPLRKYFEVDVYIATYDHKYIEDLMKSFEVTASCVHESMCNQSDLLLQGLQLISSSKSTYDYVVTTRFDALFFAPIDTWRVNIDKFVFPFRELHHFWTDHRKVCDVFHILPYKYLVAFMEALKLNRLKSEIHLVYDDLAERIGVQNIDFVVEGCYDSCPEKMPNPLYTVIRIPAKEYVNSISYAKNNASNEQPTTSTVSMRYNRYSIRR